MARLVRITSAPGTNQPFSTRRSSARQSGPPSDSDTAIRELERLRETGAHFIIFDQPAFWWLDFYAEFVAYVGSSYSLVLNDDRLIAFSLSPQTKPENMTGKAARS